MNLYKVGADLAYGAFNSVSGNRNPAETERRSAAMGKRSAADWRPPLVENARGKAKVLPLDCVGALLDFGHGFLLGARAREVLAPMLLPCGEHLPVQIDGSDYCWFNCTTVADIADQDGIQGEFWEDKTRETLTCWKSITRWSFHPGRVATAPAVFTVPQDSGTMMCTDLLRQAVETYDLLGFRFDLLWSPESGGVEINNSLGQFFGESGRQLNIAARERRKAMQARLNGRLAKAAPTP